MKSSFLGTCVSQARSVNKSVSCGWCSHNIFPLMCLLGLPEMIEQFCLAFMWAFLTGNSYRNMAALEH